MASARHLLTHRLVHFMHPIMRPSNETRHDAETLRGMIREWASLVGRSSSVDEIDFGPDVIRSVSLGPPVSETAIRRWESTHGFSLPFGLKKWMTLSDGLVVNGLHWIHPLRCIGPSVRFGHDDRLLQQPLSWYEFSNPADSPLNMDLIVSPEDSDDRTPIFVTGEEHAEDSCRIIAHHFSEWFENVIRTGFVPYWTSSPSLGDPIAVHYANMAPPKLPPKLCLICKPVGEELIRGSDERELMRSYRLNREELELIITAFQYRRQKSAGR
jgi:hypothetical protein